MDSNPFYLSSALHFFPIILFLYTTLVTGMTGISFHMQWPLTSQSRGSLSQFFSIRSRPFDRWIYNYYIDVELCT
jgi:hypothetical protein